MQCDFFFSSRRRHTRCLSDWSSDVCSSDLDAPPTATTSFTTPPPRRVSRGHHQRRDARREERRALRVREAGLANEREEVGQIGRASCRERVEDSGASEACKDKENRYAAQVS